MLAFFPDEIFIDSIPPAFLVASLSGAEFSVANEVPGVLVTTELTPANLAVLLGVVLLLFIRHV